MNDTDFRKLLDALGLSWAGYRRVRKGVKKRLVRHMHRLGCSKMDAYIRRLKTDPGVRAACDRLMTVSVSRFFRDPAVWTALEKAILPEMVPQTSGAFAVWSAGCACGEEAYSMSILWRRLRRTLSQLPDLSITATDINPDYLDKARAGIYSPSSLREVRREDLEGFFRRTTGRSYALDPTVKAPIAWKCRHLLDTPPDTGFHLIFLRNNVLTYAAEPLRGIAFRNVVQALRPEGYLIVGSQEQIPDGESGWRRVPPFAYICKKTVL